MMKKLISSLVLVSTVYGAADSPIEMHHDLNACKRTATFSPKSDCIAEMTFSGPLFILGNIRRETVPISLQLVFTKEAAAKETFDKMQKAYPPQKDLLSDDLPLIIQQNGTFVDINASVAYLLLIEEIISLMDLQPADKNKFLTKIGETRQGFQASYQDLDLQPKPQIQFTTDYSVWNGQRYATLTPRNNFVSEIKLTSPLLSLISDEITLEIFFKTQEKAQKFLGHLVPERVNTALFGNILSVLKMGKSLNITQENARLIIKTTSSDYDADSSVKCTTLIVTSPSI